jgi:nucleoid DNA-binding protein
MRKTRTIALLTLLGAFGLAVSAEEPPGKKKEAPKTLEGRIAKATKFTEPDTQKFIQALGPAIREMLESGSTVEIPNLGTFRVVRIPEHRDLVGGRPATIPGSNYVEFLPTAGLVSAANGAGAVPAETVPPFEYIINPYQTPSMKQGTTRQQGQRNR